MKILQLHNFYQHAGGESRVLQQEAGLLSQYGHSVELFSLDNAIIRGPLQKLKTALNSSYSPAVRKQLYQALQALRPDIVHVHNFFPLLTPSVYDACQDAEIPVVQTLHNYRTICPGALLMRDGRVCEDCLTGSAYQSVRHGCYRGSPLATLPVAHMVEQHRRQGTWQTKVDRFIALSDFSRRKFVQAGFPADKISLKPNFCANEVPFSPVAERHGVLFVGRLSEEKGVRTLIKAWQFLDVPLRVIGDGPLESVVRQAAHPNITLLGRKNPAEVAEEMRRASCLIVPSESYETFGLVIIEAFSQGLPVIASRLGALEELVMEDQTGLLFEAGNASSLAEKIRWAAHHPNKLATMGLKARMEYEAHYTPEANYARLMAVYSGVIEQRRNSQLASHH